MAFTIRITVNAMADRTYDVCVHTGRRGIVMRTSEEVEMCAAILSALQPFLDDDFKKKQRIPIPRHLSLVVANDDIAA